MITTHSIFDLYLYSILHATFLWKIFKHNFALITPLLLISALVYVIWNIIIEVTYICYTCMSTTCIFYWLSVREQSEDVHISYWDNYALRFLAYVYDKLNMKCNFMRAMGGNDNSLHFKGVTLITYHHKK